jgi:hypothetical protein
MDPNEVSQFKATPDLDPGMTAKQLLGTLGIKPHTGLADPLLTKGVKKQEKTKVPKIHKTTEDANRYTIFVPFDATTLSLGQAAPQWIDDRGMTSITNHHVHFSVVGMDDDPRTIVTLGGPVSSFPIPQFDLDGSQFPITEHHGYKMVTEGDAVHDARLSHHLLSREKDILIRTSAEAGDDATTSQLQIQSDNGAVTIQGGGPTTLSTANNLTLSSWSTASIPDFFNTKEAGFWVEKAASYTALALITIKGVKDLISGWRTVMVKPAPSLPIWLPKPCPDTIVNMISTALTVATITQSAIDWAAAAGSDGTGEMAAGNVGMTAEKNVCISSGISNTIWGNLGSYLVGGGSADVLGFLSASLTGIGVAAITGGLSATLTALGEAKVASELSKATMTGKTGVEVAAEIGSVDIQAAVDVEAKAMVGSASFHGGRRAYLGSGKGVGFGVVAKPASVTIGAVTNPDMLGTAMANPLISMAFDMMGIKATVAGTKLELAPAALNGASPAITLQATGTASIQGAVVLLG